MDFHTKILATLNMFRTQMTPPTPIPFELRIGVTGHRHLSDEASVAQAVEKLLTQIENTLLSAVEFPRGPHGSHQRWPQKVDDLLCRWANHLWDQFPASTEHVPPEQRTPIEWTVVSPLAKGSDRIVTKAVLARPHAQLKVIIPFATTDYETDFGSLEDLGEFRQLLARAADLRELDHPSGRSIPAKGPAELELETQLRNEGYSQVGKEIVEESEILIAIWDGRSAAGKGGTAEIVTYAVERGRVVLWIDSNHPSRGAQMISPRPSNREPEGPLPGMTCQPFPARAKRLSRGLHQLAAYNRDAAFDAAEYQSAYQHNVEKISGVAEVAGLPESMLVPLRDELLCEYARADLLAIRYQKLYLIGALGLHGLSAFSVTVAVIQVLFFPHHLWIIGLEILALLAAVGLLRVSRGESWHEKWLHDRHLAEEIRIAMFTSLLPDCSELDGRAPHEALPFYRGPDSWVRDAVHRSIAKIQFAKCDEKEFPAIKRFLIDAWLKDQMKFHTQNAHKKSRAAHWIHRCGFLLFLTTLTMACLHWAGVGHPSGETESTALTANMIAALAIVLPAWGAAIHAINLLRERERIAARSTEMARILGRIVQNAEHARDFAQLGTHVARARQVMATENLEWWIALSFRDLQLQG